MMHSVLAFGIGSTELIILLVIVLILFGAGKLPGVGEALGKGIRNFKRATSGDDEVDITRKPAAELKASGSDVPKVAEVTDASVVDKKS